MASFSRKIGSAFVSEPDDATLMKPKLKRYLRSYRRRWGLTQGELAYLIGLKSGTAVSRMERHGRKPTLPVALACHALFGIPPSELFPADFAEIEDAVMRRSYKLYERLQGRTSRATKTKLDFLEEVLARAKERNLSTRL